MWQTAEELRRERDQLHERAGDGLVSHRWYEDGPGGYPPHLCNEGPPPFAAGTKMVI